MILLQEGAREFLNFFVGLLMERKRSEKQTASVLQQEHLWEIEIQLRETAMLIETITWKLNN